MIGPVPGDGDAYELDEDDLRPGDQVRKLPKRKPRLGGAVPVRFPPEKTASRSMPRSHRGMGSTAGRRPSVARYSARTIGRRRGLRREHPCRSEEHTSELQSLMRISYAVFCLKKKKTLTHKRAKQ